jgi:hypothetical protein
MYDTAMENLPEEEARINGPTPQRSEKLDGASVNKSQVPNGKSMKSFTKTATNKSHMSNSTYFGNNIMPAKPSTAFAGARGTIGSPTSNMTRGTFSMAGRPKINQG